ncbi:hypothetical protein FIBSPDRAFT_853469 [Athelia psychrophila]|uniref:Uncharacterized protein n=1 Tax=Athelia psychrophila TaxID=1759441 RepID=A0A166QVT7_9AGAM|nr:hypothetical protein FIBSPDRAFT_853469 [Fibularhizoctonia sp. CBS 109695]
MAPVNRSASAKNAPLVLPVACDSAAGRDLCELEGVCPVLDGLHLPATTPTGSGKTGYLTQLDKILQCL